MRPLHHALAAACLLLAGAGIAGAEEGGKRVALFDATLLDSSLGSTRAEDRAAETARLARFNRSLREGFEERGYTLLPLDPVRDVLDRTVNPASCNDCEIRMGEALGADLTVTGEIRKVSTLILAFDVVVRDVATGTRLRAGAVEIRGNTDRSWERGLSYLLRNRVFRNGETP